MTHTPEDNLLRAHGSHPEGGSLRGLHAFPKLSGLSRSAVALFRVGTYRARLAAALMLVAGGLLYQIGAQAMEQSSRKVLYLDAPSVSVPRAEKAGEVARGYAGPDSSVDDTVLAWVDVKPVPQEARKAFASITDPSGQPPGGISYDNAVAAGDSMVAQLPQPVRMANSPPRTRSGPSWGTARRPPTCPSRVPSPTNSRPPRIPASSRLTLLETPETVPPGARRLPNSACPLR